jgi:hypothetical protein
MDYRLVAFPILYPLRLEGIRGYFSDDIIRPVAVSMDQRAICCPVESSLNTLAAKLRLLRLIGIMDRDDITI